MRIGLITPDAGHPLLAGATALLTPGHRVEVLDPGTVDGAPQAPADVYLLKARTPRALALARELERRGAPVVNSAAATELCQDRTEMAELARRAGLPFAATQTFASLAQPASGPELSWPVVIKSRRSRRGDLVARVDSPVQLAGLAREWPREPVVVQEFAPNSGWDHKLWAIGDQVFAALRRSELAPEGRGPTLPLPELPPGWADLVRRAGEVFALDVYGVDIIDTGGGTPLIVDINAFPGIRGQAGAPEALAALALRRAGAPPPRR
ncbi:MULTISPECIES: RimK family alpha-L-glutamate ligase [unclassified Streptomyces]|uniref:ATP-grasp domain-containing protein n=1 Tax=unclassified Streptomyces TaxID=2593676 RepID=UPI001BEAAB62|nr:MULTISPECIES: alpha-L-glutamate ligase [unclassified Streptomyces]MBT2404259.1 alpha-L-glutamate ligase [Streptomyces sp. ISL-21]MBT2612936.1 alpha-L-glutamate ligase [Streptomyces sp. ISL-87]